MLADSHLPWYFGTGPSTAQGDSGLRSSLGGQLEVLRSGAVPTPSINTSRIEEDMINRLSTGHLLAEVSARLRIVGDQHERVLRLHYSQPSPCYGLSASVWLLAGAKPYQGLTETLRVALRKNTALLVELEAESTVALAAARLAYENATPPRRRRVWA